MEVEERRNSHFIWCRGEAQTQVLRTGDRKRVGSEKEKESRSTKDGKNGRPRIRRQNTEREREKSIDQSAARPHGTQNTERERAKRLTKGRFVTEAT
jgi:hypothetical protein